MSTFRQKKPFRKQTMTIGIAALCTRQEGDKKHGVVIGAADRLVTIGQGEITYEPLQKKIHMLTTLIVAIPGGNININAEVVNKTKEALLNKIGVSNHLVDDVADLYPMTNMKIILVESSKERCYIQEISVGRVIIIVIILKIRIGLLKGRLRFFGVRRPYLGNNYSRS